MSAAYQEVIAQRVREDEQITFFGQNKVALPTRVTNFMSGGSKAEPALSFDYLHYSGAGKAGAVSDVIDCYIPNAIQVT